MLITGVNATSFKNNLNFGGSYIYTKEDRRRILDRMGDLAELRDAWLAHGDTKETKRLDILLHELIRIFTDLITFREVRGRDDLFQ